MSSRKIPYSIVDVFTAQRFSGNPLAVIKNATGLSHDEMRCVAREFGFSETTFILPPEDKKNTATVRIFTPYEEIPFAGHPNVGTAYVVATEETVASKPSSDKMVFEEAGGKVSVRLVRVDGRVAGANITAPQSLDVLQKCTPQLMAKCLGLSIDQIITQRMGPCVASVGLPFVFVQLRDLQSLSNIDTSNSNLSDAISTGLDTADAFSICAFVLLTEAPNEINARVRVLNPLSSPREDPATGSAAGALAALLSTQRESDGLSVRIKQGVEIGRPGEISILMDTHDSPPRIGGSCVSVARGELLL